MLSGLMLTKMLPRVTEKIRGDNLPEVLRAAPSTEQILNNYHSLILFGRQLTLCQVEVITAPPPASACTWARGGATRVGPESKQPTAQHSVAAL